MTSGLITSWWIESERVETVTDFLFLGSKITVDSDCSHEIKRCLLLGRKAMTNIDRVFKNRDITLLTNFCIVKAMVFPVVMYGCESWTIKKAEHQELMLLNCGAGEDCSESLGLQEKQTSHSYRKSTLNIQWKNLCWNWSSNTLATWCRERLKAKEGCGRRWYGLIASLTQWIWIWVNSGKYWRTEEPGKL